MMHPPFNTTFLALIPKKDEPTSFEDFRLIALCNCIYKIVAKIISRHLKPILSEVISKEQFGFLNGRQIHEAIRVAQEGLHSLKSLRSKGVVLKIDLSKAFDRVSWSFIRLLLTHLGFEVPFIRWIMA
jgi:retron-type reverse transcriptase